MDSAERQAAKNPLYQRVFWTSQDFLSSLNGSKGGYLIQPADMHQQRIVFGTLAVMIPLLIPKKVGWSGVRLPYLHDFSAVSPKLPVPRRVETVALLD